MPPRFCPTASRRKQGDKLKQAALAATLDQLANAGLDDFYRGDVGREIAADLERIGSPVTREDLRRYHAAVKEPMSVKLDVGTVFNTPAPTQGLASLLILALYQRLRVTEAEGFDFAHGLVECTKRAFRVRDRYVTDPAQLPHPAARYLEAKFLDIEVQKIDRRKAAKWPAPAGDGDTIWMGAADARGLVVSYIQSLYWEFGSGCVLPATGVLMQNRGASFSLDPKAVNPLQPGRLPFHTLNPALAVLGDGRVMAYGTMGGDGQPQTQAMLFARHVIYRQPLDKALDAPRWLLGRTWGSTVTNLRMEQRFDGNLIDRLMSAGHDVDVLDAAYSDTMGHAGAVVLHAGPHARRRTRSAGRRRGGGRLKNGQRACATRRLSDAPPRCAGGSAAAGDVIQLQTRLIQGVTVGWACPVAFGAGVEVAAEVLTFIRAVLVLALA